MTAAAPQAAAPASTETGASACVSRWWVRHDGLDGAIRTGGAVAVVVTIELLAGYFLWRGVTEVVRIPEALGWALQFGLTGGSVVGTRAFHRGRGEDMWWGLATSLLAVLCVVFDAAVAALLVAGVLVWNPGWLAVGVLVQCLVVGYLTVHTLMARPRAVTAPAADAGWGPAESVLPPTPKPKSVAPPLAAPSPAIRAVPSPAASGSTAGVKPRSSMQRLRDRAKPHGITVSRKGYRELRLEVEAAEAAARGEQVPA